jgi:hypothetical protein
MTRTSPAVWVIGPVVVLLGSLALGFGIRAVRLWRAEAGPKVECKQEVEQIQAQPVPASPELEKPQTEAAEQEYPVEEAVAELAPEPRQQPEEEPDNMPDETAEYKAQQALVFGGWREVWANLNLTEEEKARLREGLRLAWERWQNMSPEEREAETSRLREMGERWQNMSDEEKREASQRMRDRFEEWRKSGDVELPELSLD